MSRKTRQIRLEHEERWPQLHQFLTYLREDWPVIEGNPYAAVDRAISDYDVSGLKEVAAEWWDWNASRVSLKNRRNSINDGLGVNVLFESDVDARTFMNEVYDRVIVRIRNYDKYWRPGKG